MPGEARPRHRVLARWRAWLQALPHRTADQREEKTTPATHGDQDEGVPPPSLDDVLRDAAQRRDAGDGQGASSPAS